MNRYYINMVILLVIIGYNPQLTIIIPNKMQVIYSSGPSATDSATDSARSVRGNPAKRRPGPGPFRRSSGQLTNGIGVPVSPSCGDDWFILVWWFWKWSIQLVWCNLRVIFMGRMIPIDAPLFTRGLVLDMFQFWCCQTDFFHFEAKIKHTRSTYFINFSDSQCPTLVFLDFVGSRRFNLVALTKCGIPKINQNSSSIRETYCLEQLDFGGKNTQYSMDWFKGKSTGNHGFYHQNRGFL